MSNRNFILALVGMCLAAASFVLWTIYGSDSQVGTPSPSLDPDKVGGLASTPTPSSSRPSHSTLHTPHSADSGNRFNSLTDPSIRWQVRVDQLRRLDASTLNQTEIDYLFALLRHQPENVQSESWWVVMNEIMEQLRKQGAAPERFTEELVEVLQDTTLDEVVRDYAVQHLAIWIAPRGDTPHEADPQRAKLAVEAIAQAITDPTLLHTTVPGTSLNALVDAYFGGAETTAIESSFAAMAPWLSQTIRGESQAKIPTRVSAINAVGMMQLAEHHSDIRGLAESPTTNPSIKLTSIAALGNYHATSENSTLHTAHSQNAVLDSFEADQALLKSLASSSTKFRFAASAALNKLSK